MQDDTTTLTLQPDQQLLHISNQIDNIRKVIEGSDLTTGKEKVKVQDAYSMRSTPQVLGATRDQLRWTRSQLEIEANDLRCTHGATVSQVDDDQVFYLMSRGIPRDDAVRLIVEGFFQPSLDRLPGSLEGLRERLTEAIAEKLR